MLRVLHVCADGDALAIDLSRRERILGLISDVITVYGEGDGVDINLGRRSVHGPREIAARVRAGLRAPVDYDVLHFHGRSLFSWDDLPSGPAFAPLDLQAARALGRRVVFSLFRAEDIDPRILDLIGPDDTVFYQDPQLRERFPWGVNLPEPERDLDRLAETMAAAYRGTRAPAGDGSPGS